MDGEAWGQIDFPEADTSTCGWDVPLGCGEAGRLVGAGRNFLGLSIRRRTAGRDASRSAVTAGLGAWSMLTCGGHGID
jgi:hypothetical protein